MKGGIEVESPARSFVVHDRIVMHLQARVEAVERAHPQRVRLKALGGRAVRRRQARKEAQIAFNVQVRAWARVTAEEHRAEHLGCLRLRLVASVCGGGSESAAHLALLSGHAKANGGAGQGIKSLGHFNAFLWEEPAVNSG